MMITVLESMKLWDWKSLSSQRKNENLSLSVVPYLGIPVARLDRSSPLPLLDCTQLGKSVER